jgi:hypothetical protein
VQIALQQQLAMMQLEERLGGTAANECQLAPVRRSQQTRVFSLYHERARQWFPGVTANRKRRVQTVFRGSAAGHIGTRPCAPSSLLLSLLR